jgi:hypothetical protein
MLNKALLASQNELNEFTHALVLECQRNSYAVVSTRDSAQFEVHFCDVNADGNEHPFFHTADWHYCWNADGSSVTNRALDIVEF